MQLMLQFADHAINDDENASRGQEDSSLPLFDSFSDNN